MDSVAGIEIATWIVARTFAGATAPNQPAAASQPGAAALHVAHAATAVKVTAWTDVDGALFLGLKAPGKAWREIGAVVKGRHTGDLQQCFAELADVKDGGKKSKAVVEGTRTSDLAEEEIEEVEKNKKQNIKDEQEIQEEEKKVTEVPEKHKHRDRVQPKGIPKQDKLFHQHSAKAMPDQLDEIYLLPREHPKFSSPVTTFDLAKITYKFIDYLLGQKRSLLITLQRTRISNTLRTLSSGSQICRGIGATRKKRGYQLETMVSTRKHDHSEKVGLSQTDHEPGRTPRIEKQSASKRKLAAVEGDNPSKPIAKRMRHQQQPVIATGAGNPQDTDSFRGDDDYDDDNDDDIATTQHSRTSRRLKKVRFEISSSTKEKPSEGGSTPFMMHTPTVSREIQPSGCKPDPGKSYPFLALPARKERAWKPKEDRYLLAASRRRDDFAEMSRILIRSEQACRRRVWHLGRVLGNQLARRPLILNKELLDEIKQDIAQQRLEGSGEHEPQSDEDREDEDREDEDREDEDREDEDREDDDIMKLVIWKSYQRRGLLDPAVTEAHEGLTAALEGLDGINPQLLELAARTFLKRRAAKS
ncbi:hypothetical protein MMC07_000828 [Pseudocyphellaria aurata]|nr:hypothetical protein [Pseudocyphellaria aurata]